MEVPGAAAARITAEYLGQLASVAGTSAIGTQQVLLLLGLYLHGELNQTELPRFTGVERSAVSRSLQSLGPGFWKVERVTGKEAWKEGLGLIESERSRQDQRIKVVRLSAQGRRLMDRAAASAAMYIESPA